MNQWRRTYEFEAYSSRLAAHSHGANRVFRPTLEVRLAFDRAALQTRGLMDSGADFSYLPYDFARTLRVDSAFDGSFDDSVAGIGSAFPVRVVELELTVLDEIDPKSMLIPFLVPLEPDLREVHGRQVRPPLVIGRHPFFSKFAVAFDLGGPPLLGRSQWSLEAVGAIA